MENNQIGLGELIKGRWYKLRINPFTERIYAERKISGNYVIFINKKLQYIGESKDLIRRINAHLNHVCVYYPHRQKRVIFKIRLEKKEERKEIEKKLILKLNPLGNIRSKSGNFKYEIKKLEDMTIPTKYFTATRKLIKTKLNDHHNLNNREIIVLKMRFGLGDDKKKCTLQEVGDKFDITRERVRQIEENAIEKLKSYKKINLKKADKKENLDSLGLSPRCINALKVYEIQTLNDLEEYCDRLINLPYGIERLYMIRGIGTKSMSEIKNLLEKVKCQRKQ